MTLQESLRRGKRFVNLVQDAKTRINEVSAADYKTWVASGQPVVLIDVREPEDFTNGHIEGALNIPRGELELEIDDLVPDQDAQIVLYCGGGSRSALAADTLQTMGYSNVFSLAGGWRSWH